MAKSSPMGVLEISIGIWFILKFFSLHVDFLGKGTKLIIAAAVILLVMAHTLSIKSERPTDDVVTITLFNMMLTVLPIVYIFMNMDLNSTTVAGNFVTLGFGITLIIVGLINLL